MLSYRWDSRAVAGLSTLLHGKKSVCFCRRGCHAPEKELLWGQVSPLCRSQFEVHYTDRSPLQRKKRFFLLFRWHFLRFSLRPLPQQEERGPISCPPLRAGICNARDPPSLPFSGLDSPGSLGGVLHQDTRLSPRTAGSARSRPPGWGLSFLIVASSFWRGEESEGEQGAPWVGLCVLLV